MYIDITITYRLSEKEFFLIAHEQKRTAFGEKEWKVR